jgi:Bacterial Ig-like domain (group 2)
MGKLRTSVSLISLCQAFVLIGCSGHQPAAPSPSSASVIVASGITVTGLDTAAIVGSSVPLLAIVSLRDGTQVAQTTEPTWTSSDERVAQVSAQGVLTAMAPGVTVIGVSVKGASGSLPVNVVMNVADSWRYTLTSDQCLFTFGCRFGNPTSYPGSARLTQTGDQIGGYWESYVYFSGRITPDGVLTLSGSARGNHSDWGTTESEKVIREWRM